MISKENDEKFMEMALKEAEKAALLGEIPVGAVIVKDGEAIAFGHNTRETEQNALGHAEINAISAACKVLGSWRLSGLTIYVTMEPCPMCAGAIINSRLQRVVYGAEDLKMGSMGSLIDLSKVQYNHSPRITKSILNKQCHQILADFFGKLR